MVTKHSPYSRDVNLMNSFGSPREEELSNSLINLKLGFKQRLGVGVLLFLWTRLHLSRLPNFS
jgi:hypothetical protein